MMCSYKQFIYWARKTVLSIDAIVFPPSVYANYEKQTTFPGPEDYFVRAEDDTIYVIIEEP